MITGYTSKKTTRQTHSFNVPSNAVLGNTRMRVSMKRSTAPRSCESFSFGEVEDYTVNIVASANLIRDTRDLISASNLHKSIFVYPNPATNNITVNLSEWQGMVTLQLYNSFGKLVQTNKSASGMYVAVDVHKLANGLYILCASDDKGHNAFIKWIKN
jgi:hypothetical protein